MKLTELSVLYRASADKLRCRIHALRAARRLTDDPDVLRSLDLRIQTLEPLLREMRELAALTEHYYDRGYPRNEKYTL